VGFGDVAAIAVASLDLELVKLLRGAIRAADIAGGKFGPGGGCGVLARNPIIDPRPHLHPEVRIEPRPVLHPTPRILPRPIIHPTPRLEPECPAPTCVPESPKPEPCPIQPPWKQLVWQTPIPPHTTLKVAQYKTDIHHKGSMLDTFI